MNQLAKGAIFATFTFPIIYVFTVYSPLTTALLVTLHITEDFFGPLKL